MCAGKTVRYLDNALPYLIVRGVCEQVLYKLTLPLPSSCGAILIWLNMVLNDKKCYSVMLLFIFIIILEII